METQKDQINHTSEQLWLKRLLFKKGLNIAIAKDLKTIDAENLLDLQVIQNSKYMYITITKDINHQIQISIICQMTFKQS